jgi:hypothetical protein
LNYILQSRCSRIKFPGGRYQNQAWAGKTPVHETKGIGRFLYLSITLLLKYLLRMTLIKSLLLLCLTKVYFQQKKIGTTVNQK